MREVERARRTVKHLLVTNDFPPKVGGIQSVLWELWRRLPSEDVTVLTTPYAGDEAWDREQPFRVVRTRERVLFPTPSLVAAGRSSPNRRFGGHTSWQSSQP